LPAGLEEPLLEARQGPTLGCGERQDERAARLYNQQQQRPLWLSDRMRVPSANIALDDSADEHSRDAIGLIEF